MWLLATGLLFAVSSADQTTANPIRKVVTLMQDMQKEIEAEGAKEQELFDKFMCFCSGGSGDLDKRIADSKARITDLASKVEEESAEKAQLTEDIKTHSAEAAQAEEDLSKSFALRSKESAEYDESHADQSSNLASLSGAIPALEKGLGGAAFVQMPQASTIRKLVEASKYTNSYDRSLVVSFLEQSGDYVPQSGQIVGILKSMKDEMEKSLKATEDEEAAAATGYAELKAAKSDEAGEAKNAVQSKSKRSGELALSIVQNQDGLEDTTKNLANDEKFAATLTVQCVEKKKQWAGRQKARAEEVAAISQTISILNDDDALDVFKKAVPAALVQSNEFGFLQAKDSRSHGRRAQALINSAQEIYRSRPLQLLSYSMRIKLKLAHKRNAADFGDVTKMIDGMVGVLSNEQKDDEKHKAFCTAEFDKSADESKATSTEISTTTSVMEEMADEIASLGEDIKTTNAEIASLDKAVAEATEQRKEEHQDFTENIALVDTAVALLAKAKNRLNKFYQPALYKAAPKVEMSMEDKAAGGVSFLQIRRFASNQAPEAPGTWAAGDVQKSEKSGGVMALIDMLVKEMEDDLKQSEFDEKTAQKEYAELMSESQATRQEDTKTITDKQNSKATIEGKYVEAKESKSLSLEKLEQIHGYIQDLHTSCDFIMDNFDMRKEARTNEIESLKNAKAVLAGANFGL